MLDLLIATHWLAEADAADSSAVGDAIARMLADAARGTVTLDAVTLQMRPIGF